MDNIAILTYTHSSCSDVWPAYFGRLDKFAGGIDSFWLNNNLVETFNGHTCLKYMESDSYTNQMIMGLEYLLRREYEFLIYSQEDFILYDNVDLESVNHSIKLINEDQCDFVKLLKSGEREFAMQASVHKVDKFYNFLTSCPIRTIWEEPKLGNYSKGKYESCEVPDEWVGKRAGKNHNNSKVWPYIATAINKGRWNMSEYATELASVFGEYRINPKVRGVS